MAKLRKKELLIIFNKIKDKDINIINLELLLNLLMIGLCILRKVIFLTLP